jgi:hypothetical protein
MTFTRGEKIYIVATFLVGALIMLFMLQGKTTHLFQKQWQFQSIDTMKYSRDEAQQGLSDPKYAVEIDKQVTDIAATGATHVAIATPYDDEFLPVLKMWVRAARLHGLHVWFRGNWSGWEGWFNYAKIDEQTHIAKTKQFILDNKDLFQDGDIFSSCPECENGGNKLNLGNPQAIIAYRQFLIAEYEATRSSFQTINKNVPSNYFSMNADVARAVMDKETTHQLDGLVVIDHYVLTPERLSDDISSIAEQSGGDIVLGEIGVPIPDIHGNMTDEQQKEWLQQALQRISEIDKLKGINYWTNKGGSTALWRQDGTPKPAVAVLKEYFKRIY